MKKKKGRDSRQRNKKEKITPHLIRSVRVKKGGGGVKREKNHTVPEEKEIISRPAYKNKKKGEERQTIEKKRPFSQPSTAGEKGAPSCNRCRLEASSRTEHKRGERARK